MDGIIFSVFPNYKEGQPLRVDVLLSKSTRVMEVNLDKVELRIGALEATLRPKSVATTDAGPYFFKFIEPVK
jgi:hypothetical protein